MTKSKVGAALAMVCGLASPGLAGPAVPNGDPAMWITTEDYPAEALVLNQQGTTAISFAIDTNGRMKDCKVDVSSGHASLDAATCNTLMARARYRPATDEKGNAIESRDTRRVRWQLPEGEDPSGWGRMATGKLVTRFMVEEDGSISTCRSEFNGKPLPEDKCQLDTSTVRFVPIYDGDGRPLRKAMKMVISIEPDDEAPTSASAKP